ncbi:MAG: DUF433 domain-containing protein [Terriglobia bacterium]
MTADRIQIRPAVMMGKPLMRGTRITVELILRKLAEGASEAELLGDYPRPTPEDIRAAILYGAAGGGANSRLEIQDGGPRKCNPLASVPSQQL